MSYTKAKLFFTQRRVGSNDDKDFFLFGAWHISMKRTPRSLQKNSANTAVKNSLI